MIIIFINFLIALAMPLAICGIAIVIIFEKLKALRNRLRQQPTTRRDWVILTILSLLFGISVSIIAFFISFAGMAAYLGGLEILGAMLAGMIGIDIGIVVGFSGIIFAWLFIKTSPKLAWVIFVILSISLSLLCLKNQGFFMQPSNQQI